MARGAWQSDTRAGEGKTGSCRAASILLTEKARPGGQVDQMLIQPLAGKDLSR